MSKVSEKSAIRFLETVAVPPNDFHGATGVTNKTLCAAEVGSMVSAMCGEEERYTTELLVEDAVQRWHGKYKTGAFPNWKEKNLR